MSNKNKLTFNELLSMSLWQLPTSMRYIFFAVCSFVTGVVGFCAWYQSKRESILTSVIDQSFGIKVSQITFWFMVVCFFLAFVCLYFGLKSKDEACGDMTDE